MRSALLTITFYYGGLEESYLRHKIPLQRAAMFNKSLNQLFTVKINYLLQMRILWITSCPFMPSKKVIGELSQWKKTKKPHFSFVCIKRTTQTQGSSVPLNQPANRNLQNHSSEVRVLLWIHTAVRSRASPVGVPPMVSLPGTISEGIPFSPCHFTNVEPDHNQANHASFSTKWPTSSDYSKCISTDKETLPQISVPQISHPFKWILHGPAAPTPSFSFEQVAGTWPFSDKKKLPLPKQPLPSHIQNQSTPGTRRCKVLTEL